MKFAYQFHHLCGTVYTQGNITFTPDGNSLLSPVGNRITIFDLVNHSSKTFAFEARKDIHTIAVSNDSRLLIAVDEDGRSMLINLKRGVVLYRFNFKKRVRVLTFSPDDKYLAVSHGNKVQVWYTPSIRREFAPFVHYRTFTRNHGDVLSINWSRDSKFLVTGSKDLTARIFALESYPGFQPVTLVGHRDYVVGAFFGPDNNEIYTVGRDGGAYRWKWEWISDPNETSEEEEGEKNQIPTLAKNIKWSTINKHAFKMDYAHISTCSYHEKMNLMVIGFDNGTFGLYETPDFNNIHTLSITQNQISTVAINKTGEWLAFGSKQLGQLLVWEWQSETYVLKQQGHYFDLNALDYSPDGHLIATGSDDSKLKLWNTTTGFCYVTFSEHSAPITSVKFTHNSQAIISASLDGTVRAFDLNRYKNFRVLTTPKPVQFMSLALDPSGQIVCAGTLDPFDIYVWSLQTGQLTDVLSGHEGPVTSLAFSPNTSIEPILASGSWDHTVRLWNVYQNKSYIEPLIHSSDVLSVSFKPDGNELCSATLNGNLQFWQVRDGQLKATIEGKRDISGGRKAEDRISAQNNASSKHFTSVCYSADGTCVLAGGRSKYVCIYETSQQILLKKFQISHNRSLDGILDKLHTKDLTEAGSIRLLNAENEDSDNENIKMKDNELLGASRAVDPGSRRQKMEILTKSVSFSPTGRSWAAASSEGLLVYALDEAITFDPFDLDETITPDTIRQAKEKHEYTRALLMSLHLNEEDLIRECMEFIPIGSISNVSSGLHATYLDRILMFVAKRIDQSPHIEFYMQWSLALLQSHGIQLNDHSSDYLSALRSIQKSITKHASSLSKLCNENQFTLDYLQNLSHIQNTQLPTK